MITLSLDFKNYNAFHDYQFIDISYDYILLDFFYKGTNKT